MPRIGVTSFEFCDEIWHQKTRIMGLPDGEEIMSLALFVLAQYWRVTDGRTDTLLSQRPIAWVKMPLDIIATKLVSCSSLYLKCVAILPYKNQTVVYNI